MEIPLLREFVIIFGLAIVVLLVCYRLKIPTIVGLIITGIVGGPHGLGLVQAQEQVEVLAKIGVIILLFTIGMEFSPRKILSMKKSFLLGGSLQVGFSILGGFLTAYYLGRSYAEAIFLGFLISLSSTAINLKLLSDRGEANSRHGRITLAILIFQDIVVVLMMLLVPYLAGKGEILLEPILWAIGLGALIIALAFVMTLYVVTPLLNVVAKTRSRELFLLSVLTICFSVTWGASLVGIPVSLGAFLSGIILSESEYRHQALGNILPFQDVFTSFFFISIGMLLQIGFLASHALTVVVVCFLVLILKAFVATGSTLALGMPLRTSLLVGFSLSQVGEFSFVLSTAGMKAGLGEPYLYQFFIAVSLLSMLLTPLLSLAAPYVSKLLYRLPLPKRLLMGRVQEVAQEEQFEDHLIIAGFGPSGQNLARACQNAGIRYVILETSPDIVREQRLAGQPIYFGDAGHVAVLDHLQIRKARAMAVLVNDKGEERRVAGAAKRANPDIFLLVRTQILTDREDLIGAGADDVIVDEFVTSAETITRVLMLYEVQMAQVDQALSELSESEYRSRRGILGQIFRLSDLELHLPRVSVQAWIVEEGSPLAGQTLEASALRPRHGVTVLVIHRNDENIIDLDPQTRMESEDVLIVFGEKKDLKKAAKLAREPV